MKSKPTEAIADMKGDRAGYSKSAGIGGEKDARGPWRRRRPADILFCDSPLAQIPFPPSTPTRPSIDDLEATLASHETGLGVPCSHWNFASTHPSIPYSSITAAPLAGLYIPLRPSATAAMIYKLRPL